jgi:hypothetical protein
MQGKDEGHISMLVKTVAPRCLSILRESPVIRREVCLCFQGNKKRNSSGHSMFPGG